MSSSTLDDHVDCHYRHEAFFYAGHDEFMDGTLRFIRGAVAGDEPILVVLGADKITALRRELDGAAEQVCFGDMGEIGANPARIIPAWQDFLLDNASSGRRVRGIGEPIWPARRSDELTECQRHEALLNVAFADPDFWLLCPDDTQALDGDVIDEARRTHPYLQHGEVSAQSAAYVGNASVAEPFDWPLPEPGSVPVVLAFGLDTLREVRAVVDGTASRAGLSRQRAEDLVLAVYEISTNSVQHGGGHGTLRVWLDDADVVCEIRDGGHITDPMLGRVRPPTNANGGRGLWLANQLCDLVQVRSFAAETVTRLHIRVG